MCLCGWLVGGGCASASTTHLGGHGPLESLENPGNSGKQIYLWKILEEKNDPWEYFEICIKYFLCIKWVPNSFNGCILISNFRNFEISTVVIFFNHARQKKTVWYLLYKPIRFPLNISFNQCKCHIFIFKDRQYTKLISTPI